MKQAYFANVNHEYSANGSELLSSIKKNRKSKVIHEVKKNAPLFLMLLPGILLTFVFNYMPMFGAVIAFKQINFAKGIWGSDWVGFKNFEFMFKTPEAWVITRNTVGYNLIFILGGLVVMVALAIALNELKNKMMSKVYQSLFILPHFLSFVIVSYLAFAFFSAENGIINKTILPFMGLEPISWYSEAGRWPWILIIVHFWKNTGYGSIVYLAAIAGIDTQLYEAAKIDGANRWQQIRAITIPSLVPLMTILSILNVGKIFNADFGLFYQVPLNSGALYEATNVINTYVFNMLNTGGTSSMGMASAAAFYQSTIGFVLVMITNTIVRRIDPDKSLF